MNLGGLHTIDLAIVAGYFAIVIAVGRLSARSTQNNEGFFLANRRLGKLYQVFLNFGHSTEPQGAVSTASFVFQQGAAGCWLSFQTVFMNPYFWFMKVWFRRVRLTTMADLFEDRFGSRGLALFCTLFQVAVVSISIGFGNVVAYRLCSSLAAKPEVRSASVERAPGAILGEAGAGERVAVSGAAGGAAVEGGTGVGSVFRASGAAHRDGGEGDDRRFDAAIFYAGFTVVIGTYLVLGGMAAAAANQAVQGVSIIVFSILLVPAGLHAIGGWSELAKRVPASMFDLLGKAGSAQFSLWNVAAILLVSAVQIHGLSHNMGLSGSARDEMAARFAVGGTYLKRAITIVWVFVGLVGVAMFGPGGLDDPDAVWGEMSRQLLGPGLIGLMLVGVLAGTMATCSVKTLSLASLLVCNVLRPGVAERRKVRLARIVASGVLVLGGATAWLLGDFLSVANLVLTVNIPFGAVVLLMFTWRRLTAPAVWWGVSLSVLVILVIPWGAASVPALRMHPALVETAAAPGSGGKPAAVYFASVAPSRADDLASRPAGRGRFNFECWLLNHAGLDVAALTPLERFTAQFLFDGLFPFAVLIGVSLITRPADKTRTELFYGKLKTPIGHTPELEAEALALTQRDPRRFDATKLWPGSSWEFCRWDRVDAVGFLVCCAISGGLVAAFAMALRWAASGGTRGL